MRGRPRTALRGPAQAHQLAVPATAYVATPTAALISARGLVVWACAYQNLMHCCAEGLALQCLSFYPVMKIYRLSLTSIPGLIFSNALPPTYFRKFSFYNLIQSRDYVICFPCRLPLRASSIFSWFSVGIMEIIYDCVISFPSRLPRQQNANWQPRGQTGVVHIWDTSKHTILLDSPTVGGASSGRSFLGTRRHLWSTSVGTRLGGLSTG